MSEEQYGLIVRPRCGRSWLTITAATSRRGGKRCRKGATYLQPSLLRPHHGPTPNDRRGVLSVTQRGTGVSHLLTLSYEDLLALPAVSVTRALDCAANDRIFFG